MPQPKSPQAYQDLIETILYPALSSPNGIAVTLPSEALAFSLKMRLFAAVAALRRQSKRVYDKEHPLYGVSDFDKLVIQQIGDEVVVRKADDLSTFFKIREL